MSDPVGGCSLLQLIDGARRAERPMRLRFLPLGASRSPMAS